jgi:hypothetical protein
MRPILAASPALLLAGVVLAAPASAQTMLMPYQNNPIATPPGAPPPTEGPQQTAGGALPRGSYLGECKDVRMLQGTLTAFCPRGDGTWQTTQLQHADSCPGGVQNAGGDLLCGSSQMGSASSPESYGSSSGSNYGSSAAPPSGYGAFGTGPQPMATGAYPVNPPPGPYQGYAAPAYNGYGPAPAYNIYGPYSGTYGPYPAPQDQYYAPSASKTAHPYGY